MIYDDFPIANILIFDFPTLQGKAGLKVLEDIMKKRSIIKNVPVIILNDDFEKVKNLEKYHPDLFLTKPNNFEEYKNVVESIKEFGLPINNNLNIITQNVSLTNNRITQSFLKQQ